MDIIRALGRTSGAALVVLSIEKAADALLGWAVAPMVFMIVPTVTLAIADLGAPVMAMMATSFLTGAVLFVLNYRSDRKRRTAVRVMLRIDERRIRHLEARWGLDTPDLEVADWSSLNDRQLREIAQLNGERIERIEARVQHIESFLRKSDEADQ